MILMITVLTSLRLFFGVAAGTASTLLALMAVAVAGSVAGGIFILSKVEHRRR